MVVPGIDGGMTGAAIGSTGTAAGSRAGWLAPNSFVLPNLYNLDMRVTKEFSIKDRYHIEVRAEAFNVLNSASRPGLFQTPAFNYVKPWRFTRRRGSVPGRCNHMHGSARNLSTAVADQREPAGSAADTGGIRFDF